MDDRFAARQTHIRSMPRRRTPLLQRPGLAGMTHRNVFGSRALSRALLKAGMVQTLPSRHVACARLRELLEGGAASRWASLGGADYGDR
jgi:hypothetical protein